MNNTTKINNVQEAKITRAEIRRQQKAEAKSNKKASKTQSHRSEQVIGLGTQTMNEVISKKSFSWKDVETGRKFTQNDKIFLINEEVLVIGMDIGSEKHDARAFDFRGFEYSKTAFEFSNTQEGYLAFDAWAEGLAEKYGKTKFLVGMEPTGHYWFNIGKWLMDRQYTVVHVNPHHVKKSKELDDNSQNKTDQKDPKVIAGLVNAGRYSMPYLPEGLYADLRNATSLRLILTEEMTRVKNRIHRWLNIYFPEYTSVYKDISKKGSILVLKAAPFPEDVGKLGTEGINQIWRAAKLRGTGKARAKALVEAAEHSVGTKEGTDTARMTIEAYMEDYSAKITQYERIIEKLDELSSQIPVMQNILEISGLGMRTMTGVIAEIGDISRFHDAKQLQKMAGLALVEASSGKHAGQTVISKRGRKRLRYLLYEAALSLIGKNAEFKEIHQHYVSRPSHPLKKMQSLMLVACKLLRLLYAMVTKGTRYDPEKLLRDIRRPMPDVA